MDPLQKALSQQYSALPAPVPPPAQSPQLTAQQHLQLLHHTVATQQAHQQLLAQQLTGAAWLHHTPPAVAHQLPGASATGLSSTELAGLAGVMPSVAATGLLPPHMMAGVGMTSPPPAVSGVPTCVPSLMSLPMSSSLGNQLTR